MGFETLHAIATRQPDKPQFAFRPATLIRAVRYFTTHFNGKISYAVKTNPEPHTISLLHQHGIKSFEVASLAEIETIKKLIPNAELLFMNPVKAPHAIHAAYFEYNVRHFSLDCEQELQKILVHTNHAKDLSLYFRLDVPNTFAKFNLAKKFGAPLDEAPQLLKKVRNHAMKLGISFHVGSQCMNPNAYYTAIRLATEVIDKASVDIEYFNVGGGFPSIYPGMTPPPLKNYFEVINEELAPIRARHPHIELLSEPGRALVAESTSLIVNVLLRKDNLLYINDGTYGTLFDAGTPQVIFPTRLLRDSDSSGDMVDSLPFCFYGPTCDTLDHMEGPFYLPSDVSEGDYIEIGQIGAYGRVFSTGFNGFQPAEGIILIKDEPIMSLYRERERVDEQLEAMA